MNHESNPPAGRGRAPRAAALAVALGVGLMGGAAWRGVTADAAPAQHPATATVQTADATARGGFARDSFADVVKVVEPSVITIRTEGRARVSPTQFQGDEGDMLRRFFGQEIPGLNEPPQTRRERALGSGVIVSADGDILTNYHVIDHADVVKVDLGHNRTLDAKIVGTDKPSDLALLKVQATDLHPIALGNSDAVQTGDVVLAVGNPLGIGETVTMGIISAKGRSTGVGSDSYEDFLQTDAPINHGNSGGALVNTKGELVGINSQIISPSGGSIGIGFAIPSNMAQNVMTQLIDTGHVRRGQLGVTVQGVTADLASRMKLPKVEGALVAQVNAGGPADKAGLRKGDVITSFQGEAVVDSNSLRNQVASTKPGTDVTIGYLREGKAQTAKARLGELAQG
jgi:Do/DeqQ family serine protease